MRAPLLRKRIFMAGLVAAAVLVPVTTAEAASFDAGLKASGHKPKAGKAWPIRVSARTGSGRALRATAYYQFLYRGQKVSTQYPSPDSRPGACPGGRRCRSSPYRFRGSYRDSTIVWPARAAGYPLTFRVVVKVKGRGTEKLDYSVRVRR